MTITSNTSAPLVVVVGSTGKQGGSVIKALSESDKQYRIRGITRDITKESAKALSKQGVEVVSAAVSAETKDDLVRAFQGATVIFAVTDFWEHIRKEKEISDGKAMVDAAKTVTGLKLYLWSGLENFTRPSNGRLSLVDHFDSKAEVTEYAAAQGLPLCNVQAALYMSNFLTFFAAPQKFGDKYVFFGPGEPTSTIPLIDTPADYGKFVRLAIEDPQFGPGTEVLACGEEITWATMVKQLSDITNKKIFYEKVTEEAYCSLMPLPRKIAKELYQMYQGIAELGYFAGKDFRPSQKAVKGKLTTWAEFAKKTDWSKVLG